MEASGVSHFRRDAIVDGRVNVLVNRLHARVFWLLDRVVSADCVPLYVEGAEAGVCLVLCVRVDAVYVGL